MKKTSSKNLKLKDISIQTSIFISFMIILLITIIAIGYITYSSWVNSVNHTIIKTTNSLNQQIIKEVDTFIKNAKHLNIANQELIEKGIIDINDESSREQFFVNALRTFEDEGIYSFSYGTESGEYYGARKNKHNKIEIMRNNKQTGGHSWYYFVKDDVGAGDFVLDAGEFDPRTRAWYKAAKTATGPIFSPIYKHFVLDDLTVSSSIPIYNKTGMLEGVLGSHINLSRINHYLEDIVADENAYAIIVEKGSGKVIANSGGLMNFKASLDGDFKRLTVGEMEHQAIEEAYNNYVSSGIDQYKMKYDKERLHIKISQYQDIGLDWIVITSLPDSLILAPIRNNIINTLILTLLAILIASFMFFKATKKYIDPMTHKIYTLIHNLEEQVEERTSRLRLILDSTAEGIYGIDLNGNCTFINASGLKMLGYENQLELVGKNMHIKIHYSKKNGMPIPREKCSIFQALTQKKGSHVSDEVFWKKDGTSFSVAYYSYPQLLDGEIVGAVVTFIDNTDSKEKLEKIEHLSIHDQLTGLYNRWYMKDAMIRLNTQRNLPFTLMVIDVNGLKLVNDAFGHEMGDQLLKLVAKVLQSVLRAEDIVGRVGGDEFLILLPKTDKHQANYIKKRILKSMALERLDSVIISVAIGYTVKEGMDESIENIMISADNQMYKDKLAYGKTMRSQTIETVLRNINFKYDQEQIHTERVSQYCESIGVAMGFSEREVEEIKTAGVLHDIGKIVVPPEVLNKAEKLSDQEFDLIKKHPETGYHILKSVDEYASFAEDVLCHHEHWDGKGYPQGLKNEKIPLNARIISIADAYEAMTANRAYQKTKIKDEAIEELKRCAGTQFDPEIVNIFIEQVLM